MKAGAALGLLAGLGALNALGGGRNGTGKRFTGLMDMLDGGGAGASGDKFEGGGLLSILGNLFAKPLEAQDNVERIAADTNATKAVTKTLEDMAKGGALTSRLDGKDGLLSPAQKEQIVMDQVVNPDVYGIGQGGEFGSYMPKPSVLSGGTTQPIPASSQSRNTGSAILTFGGGEVMPQPNLPNPETFSANPPSAAAMTPPVPAPEDRNSRLAAFNRRMESVPEFYRGTEIESMYRDHVLNGGLAYFDQFIRGSMSTQDQGLLRAAPSYATMPMGEAGRGMPDMPLPRVGNQAVPLRTLGAEFYDQPNITPDYAGDYTRRQDYSTKTPSPSGMSPTGPSMSQGIMSFREFVDAERAAMSGADLYVDPANYRRGYARYLSSMGINPATMGM
jgi:hypothetical protein